MVFNFDVMHIVTAIDDFLLENELYSIDRDLFLYYIIEKMMLEYQLPLNLESNNRLAVTDESNFNKLAMKLFTIKFHHLALVYCKLYNSLIDLLNFNVNLYIEDYSINNYILKIAVKDMNNG